MEPWIQFVCSRRSRNRFELLARAKSLVWEVEVREEIDKPEALLDAIRSLYPDLLQTWAAWQDASISAPSDHPTRGIPSQQEIGLIWICGSFRVSVSGTWCSSYRWFLKSQNPSCPVLVM